MTGAMKYRVGLWFGLLMAMASPGCAQFDLRRDIPWRIGEVVSPKTPTKIVAIWTDAVLHQPGKPPTRGFGGRLMFYSPEESAPIKVDGTLIVYAFDEEGRAPNDVKPDRKYVFPPDQFARHYSKSKLGHSYSVWIPWDQVGGPRKEISLIARFIPKNGAAIVSAPSRQILPGVLPPEDPAYSEASGSGSLLAGHLARAYQPPAPLGQEPLPANSLPAVPEAPVVPAEERPLPAEYSPFGRSASLMGRNFQQIVPESSHIGSEKETEQRGANPLRPASYEQPASANKPRQEPMDSTKAVRETPSGQTRPRMRTTTIPIPAPLIRRRTTSFAQTQGGTNPGFVPFPGESPQALAERARRNWLQDNRNSPLSPSESPWGGEPQSLLGTQAEEAPGQPEAKVTGLGRLPEQASRWTSGRPAIRSGPIGPQAPTGPIAPPVRDRAALPPLP